MSVRYWKNLYERFTRSATTLRSHREFGRIRARRASLAPFSDPVVLLSYVHDEDQNLDSKDVIYADLIREVQASRAPPRIAMTLIWLGLWPGLDSAYHYCTRFFRNEEQELVASFSEQLTRHVHCANLETLTRVASTLVRNTKRDVRDQRLRLWKAQKHEAYLPTQVAIAASNDTEDAEYRLLLDKMRAIAGSDAHLLELVLVEGLTLREAADELDQPLAATTKRFQRARDRLRNILRDD